MRKYALIVAGGQGLRMGGDLPKQFIPLGDGHPVLMHTIHAFNRYDAGMEIVLVIPRDHQIYWKQLCEEHNFDIPHQIAYSGQTRFHSVKNGLMLVTGEALVAVHDGVRPFISKDVIHRCFQLAEEHRAVIPVIPVFETVRQIYGNTSRTVNRDEYKLVQTPQVFQTDLLKEAYQQTYSESFTDDASVVEAMNIPIYLTEGNRENMKITTPFDLKIANALLECLT